jgi:pyruvate-ferredoxin/flavodoxin oxidoreductase
MNRPLETIEGNEAAAYVAYKTNEVIAIYPITPSSTMGEYADQWMSEGKKNLWGSVPVVKEMQSEGGAAGAVHGALQAGALATTFTASQGLLLMIPNMYKIAGELTSTVFHIAARAIAAQALSIFGDHSDVMSARSTGWAMLFSNSGQEIMDLALVSRTATLESRVPFLHVFDGFRSSAEVTKIEMLTDDDMKAMVTDELVQKHRARALTPEHPVLRGSAQDPDVYFQGRESSNPYYLATPTIVQNAMDQFAGLTGRQYHLFDYVGAPDAERVIVMMGSGCEATEETIEYLLKQGEKVGVLKVRLYRPFSIAHFVDALPKTVKILAAMDRTKEPGSAGEPLYQDVVTALFESGVTGIKVIGGRYGLASKEFNTAMVKGIFDEMSKAKPKNHFVVGINDDVTHTSIDYDPEFSTEADDVVRAVFYGLGADGTVGANKNSIKIIGEETPNYVQGYFVYDSKKSGSRTISHLRFGPRPIKSTYLIHHANFVAVHQFGFFERFNVLETAAKGATLLINSPFGPEATWDELPITVQQQIIDKQLKVYVIDGYDVAKAAGMGNRVNTVMQACFFAISGVLPRDEAIAQIKKAIKKTYGKRGEAVVNMNYAAVDSSIENMHEIKVPAQVSSKLQMPAVVSNAAPDFVKNFTAKIIAGDGNLLPVSAMPVDGTYPTGTAMWEKRNIALEVPVWDTDVCIQCGKCVLVCPHAVIRAKTYDAAELASAPATFKTADARWKELPGQKYTLQVAVEDCTGCALCVEACPAKNKSAAGRKAINMASQLPLRETERANWDFFLSLPEVSRAEGGIKYNNVKNVQLLQPLFEFSGACSGCGETPYIKLVSQLFGERAIIANATGCTSIYGGNLPTTPWTFNKEGRGPAWANSLFEDNAEFGLGMRLTVDKQTQYARELIVRLRDQIGAELADGLLNADMNDEAGIVTQRKRVAQLKLKLNTLGNGLAAVAKDLHSLADLLVKKSVWIMGGDGWAYDIGYGGLDHVLASGLNVNVLVLDTEVYSNTGGQASKSTPLGAVAKFAAGGKPSGKKDLGAMAMTYGNVYVATLAMGSSDAHTVRTILEAEAYNGPSLIIAYSHCIAHGIDMSKGMNQQKLAVDTGYWPLYHYNPMLKAQGKNPFVLDSAAPKLPLKDYAYNETRYRMLSQSNPTVAEALLTEAQKDLTERWRRLDAQAKAQ